jgi:hypothetical protein
MVALPHPGSIVALVASSWLVIAVPADGEAPRAARAVIDHYLQATGGRTAFEAESTLHVKGRLVADGMKGTYEAWIRQPDGFATRVTLGSLRLRTGCWGQVAWETDLNSNRVRVLDGKDLEAELEEAWFQTEQWARSGEGGGTVAVGSSSFMGDVQRQALEITPPVGRSRTLWFDTKTGFLDRVRSAQDHHQGQEWLLDYRLRAGRKRPLSLRPDDALLDGQRDGLTIDSVWANVPVAGALFEPPAPRVDDHAWLKSPGRAQLPLRYESRAVWVKASINGAPPADFILDTGCSVTSLDRDYALSLGLVAEGSSVVEGIGAQAEAAYSTVERLRLAGPDGDGVELRSLHVSLVDLSDWVEPVLWRKTAGLIGYDFFSRFVTEIDYDHGRVTLQDPEGFAYRGRGEAVPMGLAHGVPTIQLTLGSGCSGVFLVDVGNSAALAVFGSMVTRCGLGRSSRRELKVYGGGIGGGYPEWLGRLDSLRIGPFAWRDPLVGLSYSTHGLIGSQDYSGNVGNSVLERFTCTFDYAHGRLYLEPGARYGERDVYSRLGAYFARIGDKVLAVGIVSDSPADSAGLELFDEMLAIDGRPVSKLTRGDLDRLFTDGPEGATHTITVLRETKSMDIEVTLRDVI